MRRHANTLPSNPAMAPPPRRRDIDPIGLATLAGVIVILMISFANMRDVDRLDRTLGERLTRLETQLAQIDTRPAAAPAPQRGPDPSRVYSINTTGAPAKGPTSAPITLVEFSDFQ